MSRATRHLASRQARQAVAMARMHDAAQRQRNIADSTAERAAVLRQMRLRMLGLPDQDASASTLELLSNLAFLLGMGAELSHHAQPGSPTARRQHGALRQCIAMCLQGYRWRTSVACAMETAAIEAVGLIDANPHLYLRFVDGADHLAAQVAQRAVRADAVAGAEVYGDQG